MLRGPLVSKPPLQTLFRRGVEAREFSSTPAEVNLQALGTLEFDSDCFNLLRLGPQNSQGPSEATTPPRESQTTTDSHMGSLRSGGSSGTWGGLNFCAQRCMSLCLHRLAVASAVKVVLQHVEPWNDKPCALQGVGTLSSQSD